MSSDLESVVRQKPKHMDQKKRKPDYDIGNQNISEL